MRGLYDTVQEQIKTSLAHSVSPRRFEAFENMASLLNLKLAKDFAINLHNHDLIPLIEYYTKEAAAKDKMQLMKAFNLQPQADKKKCDYIFEHIDVLYRDNCSEQDYEKAFTELKVMIFEERLRQYLPDGIHVGQYHQEIVANINNPTELQRAVNNIPRLQLDDSTLAMFCNGFETLRMIKSYQEMRENVVSRILNIMNEDFKREIIVLNDFQEITMTGQEQLFRSVRRFKSASASQEIQIFFNQPHYLWFKERKSELFNFNIKRSWTEENQEWEIDGVYTSFNKYVSILYDSSSPLSHLVLDIRPHKNKHGFIGMHFDIQEIAFNHIIPEEIRCIYEIENGVVKKIHHNPNYKANMHGEAPLAFKIGQNLKALSSLTVDEKELTLSREKYDRVKFFVNDRGRYSSKIHFNTEYTEEKIAKRRQEIIARKNYPSANAKLQACLEADFPSLAMGYLYTQFKEAIEHKNAVIMKRLKDKTLLFTGVNSEGNNVLQMAISHGDDVVCDYILREKLVKNINHQNLRGETAAHLAIEKGNSAVLYQILSEPGFDKTKKDITENSLVYVESDAIKLITDNHASLELLYDDKLMQLIRKGEIKAESLNKLTILPRDVIKRLIELVNLKHSAQCDIDVNELIKLDTDKIKILTSDQAFEIFKKHKISVSSLAKFGSPDIKNILDFFSKFDELKKYNITLDQFAGMDSDKIKALTTCAPYIRHEETFEEWTKLTTHQLNVLLDGNNMSHLQKMGVKLKDLIESNLLNNKLQLSRVRGQLEIYIEVNKPNGDQIAALTSSSGLAFLRSNLLTNHPALKSLSGAEMRQFFASKHPSSAISDEKERQNLGRGRIK